MLKRTRHKTKGPGILPGAKIAGRHAPHEKNFIVTHRSCPAWPWSRKGTRNASSAHAYVQLRRCRHKQTLTQYKATFKRQLEQTSGLKT